MDRGAEAENALLDPGAIQHSIWRIFADGNTALRAGFPNVSQKDGILNLVPRFFEILLKSAGSV